MNHFLHMIAAGKSADVFAAHRCPDVAIQQQARNQTDLIHVVALLPAANFAPRDLVRRVHQVERVSGHAPGVPLMLRDTKVPQLELVTTTNEDIERRKITMQRVPSMQNVQRARQAGDFAAYEALWLSALTLEKRAEIAVFGVFHGEAVADLAMLHLDEPIEDLQRPIVAIQQLGEIRLAQPALDSVADLHANLARQAWG